MKPSTRHSRGNEMSTLTATNLKNTLWDTLIAVKSGTMQPGQWDAVAAQAREIIRTTNLQLRIAQISKRNIPTDVIDFSEKAD